MRSALSQPAPATGLESRLVVAPDLARLPLAQLQAMRLAGREILEMYRVLKKVELNIVGEVLLDALNKGETFYEFNHYPDDDVYDRETHAQYYYHAHRSETGEHGHFLCFLRPRGMPAGVSPSNIPRPIRGRVAMRRYRTWSPSPWTATAFRPPCSPPTAG